MKFRKLSEVVLFACCGDVFSVFCLFFVFFFSYVVGGRVGVFASHNLTHMIESTFTPPPPKPKIIIPLRGGLMALTGHPAAES